MTPRCGHCRQPIGREYRSHWVLERGGTRPVDISLCSLECLAAHLDQTQESIRP